MSGRIPTITDSVLRRLSKTIRPVVRHEDGRLFLVAATDPRTYSFAWADSLVEDPALREIGRVTTFHTFGYYGFFKPSVAEALAQLPSRFHKTAVAFTVVPDTSTNRYALTDDQELHHGIMIVYGVAP